MPTVVMAIGVAAVDASAIVAAVGASAIVAAVGASAIVAVVRHAGPHQEGREVPTPRHGGMPCLGKGA